MFFDNEPDMEVSSWYAWCFICLTVEDVLVVVRSSSFDGNVYLGCLVDDLLALACSTYLVDLPSFSITLLAGFPYMLIHSRTEFNNLLVGSSSFAVLTASNTDASLSIACLTYSVSCVH